MKRLGTPSPVIDLLWIHCFIPAVSKLEAAAAPKRLPDTTGTYHSTGEQPQLQLLSVIVASRTSPEHYLHSLLGDRTQKQLAATTLEDYIHNCSNAPQCKGKHPSSSRQKKQSPDPVQRLEFGGCCFIPEVIMSFGIITPLAVPVPWMWPATRVSWTA